MMLRDAFAGLYEAVTAACQVLHSALDSDESALEDDEEQDSRRHDTAMWLLGVSAELLRLPAAASCSSKHWQLRVKLLHFGAALAAAVLKPAHVCRRNDAVAALTDVRK
jgi:hypothetical protein